ncbi:MAG: MFS transporter [Burkholderiales bacterium]
MGICAAFLAPAWQAVVPQLVPKAEVPAAIALNSVGINISRAIGPAVGGAIIAGVGIAWPFMLNAISFVAVIAAVWWWKPPPAPRKALPAERFVAAMRSGVRYARASPPLQATFARAVAFFLFASAYWALLPLIARQTLAGDARTYGTLVTCIGVGAVAGAIVLPRMRKRLGADKLVVLGTLGTMVTLLIFALAGHVIAASAASLLAGVSWIAVLSSLNVSAQMSLPDWVRARGLSGYNAVFFGAMALGSVIWGQVAGLVGIAWALLIASGGGLLGIVLTRRFRLQTGGELNLAPSSHWPQPIVEAGVLADAGPVMTTVEYRIDPATIATFMAAMDDLEMERRRDGAYAWGVFQDTAQPGRVLEYFIEESWLEHLRHHERVTQADRDLQARVHALHVGAEPPRVAHYLAVAATSRFEPTAK